MRFDPLTDTSTMFGEEYKGFYKWKGGCLAVDGNVYAAPNCSATKVLKIRIARWELLKEHIMLKWLIDQGRASAINSDDVEMGHSCYQNFIQCPNDIFCMILKFL